MDIWVAKTTEAKKAAGALQRLLTEEGQARVYAVGAGAVNQAVKAIAIARARMAAAGNDVTARIWFDMYQEGKEERTRICFGVLALPVVG